MHELRHRVLEHVLAHAENLLNEFLAHWTLDRLTKGAVERMTKDSAQTLLTNQNGGE
ncbi:MAG: hypothetical protein ABF586_01630 [Sporolactobacillus sp.]